jgi:hypothetical protein
VLGAGKGESKPCLTTRLLRPQPGSPEEATSFAAPRNPSLLASFLKGASLFRGNLALLGRFGSTLIGARLQPFSLIDINKRHKPSDTPTEILYVGTYTAARGGLLAINCSTHRAMFSSRNQFGILKRWPTFEQAFLSEVKRLSKLYDENGMLLREDESLLPTLT